MSEQRIGRIRKDGGWDRRYRPPWRQATPYRPTWREHVREALSIVWQSVALIAILGGIVYGLAVAALVQS